jgi:hypothetical protein
MQARKRKGLIRWVLVLAALITVAACWSSEGAFAAGFCAPTTIREYAPPLKGMRSVNRPPSYPRSLSFGPQGIEVLPIGLGAIAVNGGKVGFYLDGGPDHRQTLDWDVGTSLSSVNRQGRIKRVLRERDQKFREVKTLSAVNLGFVVGSSPRFYRVDVTFRDLSGRTLGRYADYFRVMPRRVDVRLGLDAGTYRAGAAVLMRLENLGTVGISFGYEFALDIWNGSSWAASPAVLPLWPQVALGLGAGLTQQCQRFQIPEDIVPGRYRLSKFYSTSLGGPFSHASSAAFEITS